MKRNLLLGFLTLASVFMTTCTNPYITELLKTESELSVLEVTAYAGELALQGGASFEPGFNPSTRSYTVHIPRDANRFTVNALFEGNGTVKCLNLSMDSATDPEVLDFELLDEEEFLEVVLTVEREFMDPGEYRLTVTRQENVPPPKNIAVTISPVAGSYFLERGVRPVLTVTAEKPTEDSVFSYQWYRNEDNNTANGTIIAGAEGTSYTLKGFELEHEGTMYYYVEVTNTVDGKTSRVPSVTRSVTFIDKEGELSAQSRSMVNVGGNFLMGEYPITYELYNFVRQRAEMEDYQFANKGILLTDDPQYYPMFFPDGHPVPVVKISWRDAVVFCNAYSEMDGKEPVYLDSEGNVLLDSRDPIEELTDESRMAGNGYRLPTWTEYDSGMNASVFEPYQFSNGGEWLWDKAYEYSPPYDEIEGVRSNSAWNSGVYRTYEFAYRIEFGIGSYILMSRIVCMPEGGN